MKTSFLFLLVLVIGGIIGWSVYTKKYPAERFYGVGPSDTRPFTVQDKWELSWACAGPIKISLKPTDKRHPLLIVNATSPTMTSAYQTTGGEYTLQIESSWPWEVSVVDVPAASDTSK